MTTRAMQVEDPAAIPAPERRVGRPPDPVPDDGLRGQVAQLAGALSALARRVEEQAVPRVTGAERRKALEEAREFITQLGIHMPGVERVHAEVAVARYLAGE